MNLHNEMYCSKNVEKLVTYKVDKARDHMMKIELNRVWQQIDCVSDMYFILYNQNRVYSTEICRVGFHSSFIKDSQIFGFEELEPDSLKKGDMVTPYFAIEIVSEPLCPECNPSMPLTQLCKVC